MATAHRDSNLRLFEMENDLSSDLNKAVALSSLAGKVRLAGVGDIPVGVIREIVSITGTDYAVVRLWAKNGTVTIVQGEAIAPGTALKVGDGGKVVAAGTGDPVYGYKLQPTTGVIDDEVEIIDVVVVSTTAPLAFTGASAVSNGATGLVPPPLAGEETLYLRGDGNWVAGTNVTPEVMIHKQALTTDLTIGSDENALVVGEFKIDSSVTLTIEDGATLKTLNRRIYGRNSNCRRT